MSAYDTCLTELDKLEGMIRRGIIVPGEYELKVHDVLAAYFEDEGVTDDVDFLVAYAREPIARWADDPLHGDREATDRFEVFLRRHLHLPAARASLSEALDQVRAAATNGDPTGIETLTQLCGSGRRTHPRIFLFRELVDETIHAARDLGAVEALVAAVDPRDHGWQQLGYPDQHGGRPRTLVFESLAELATRRGAVGDQALDALVEMCCHVQTAAQASVHLPAYRLTNEHRASLLDSAEALSDLIAADTFHLPAFDANRAPGAIRSVLWLANDADRLSR